jgi:hypothetical protein
MPGTETGQFISAKVGQFTSALSIRSGDQSGFSLLKRRMRFLICTEIGGRPIGTRDFQRQKNPEPKVMPPFNSPRLHQISPATPGIENQREANPKKTECRIEFRTRNHLQLKVMMVYRKLAFSGQQPCRQLSSWEKENSEERQGITTQQKNTPSRISEGQENAS